MRNKAALQFGSESIVPAWDTKKFVVRNASRDATLATNCGRASNILSRGFGLMMHRDLPDGTGLIIEPCNSVVSFFMRFPFDALFVGKDGSVLHVVHSMKSWRTSSIVRHSTYVVELPAGTLKTTQTEIGDAIEYAPVDA